MSTDANTTITDQIKKIAGSVEKDAQGRFLIPERLKQLCGSAAFLEMSNNLKVIPLIKVSTEVLLAFAHAKIMPDWIVPAVLCERGDTAGLRSYMEAFPEYKPTGSTLTWSIWRLKDHPESNPSAENIRLLVEKGADPNYSYDGDCLLSKAIRFSAPEENILVLIQSGANVEKAYKDLQRLKIIDQKDALQHFVGRSFFEMADSHTMIMHKIIKDAGTVISLKRIFDFEAQRVTETLGAMGTIGYSMDDCNPDLVTRVKEKLRENGGDPLDLSVAKAPGNLKLPLPGNAA